MTQTQADNRGPQPDPGPSEPCLITARGLDHGSGGHRIYAGLDFDVPAGRLAVAVGPAHSGKSLLLLALTGRSGRVQGSLRVAGHDAQKQSAQVRRLSAAARIGEFADVSERHTVTDALRERAAIEGVRRANAERGYRDAAEALGLDAPDDHRLEELDALRRTQLTLALAFVRPSRLVVLDDADHRLSLADQQRLHAGIGAVVEATGTTVVASADESQGLPPDTIVISLPPAGSARRTDEPTADQESRRP